jgi:hypothetical protein
MKNRYIHLLVVTFVLAGITGCASGKPFPYSFADNADGNGTATITFISTKEKEGVDLHYFEDIELPIPAEGKYWAPVTFPAGRPFTLTVNVYYSDTDTGKERPFDCPALTAGKDYKLQLKRVGIFFARFNLILIDAKTKKVVYEQPL